MTKVFLIFLIKIYKRHISPYKKGPVCRFYPSCSTYAIQAIEKYGAFKGSYLAIKRIIRCNPLVKGGIDFLP